MSAPSTSAGARTRTGRPGSGPRTPAAPEPGTGPQVVLPLAIPTYDGDPQVTHPSVVYVPAGLSGYRYWLAFTPYPDEDRENPSVVASHNGVDFEVPAGLTNPVVPLAECQAAGYGYGSDPHLLRLPTGELALYYRLTVAGVRNGLFRKVSADGITWSPAQPVILDAAVYNSLLSPAVELGADGLFHLWVNNSAARRVTHRASYDGLAFGPAEVCVFPRRVPVPWHLDVKIVAGRYHMLLQAPQIPGRLYFLTSDDGLAWRHGPGAVVRPAVRRTGFALDAFAHYRSALLPVPGEPGGPSEPGGPGELGAPGGPQRWDVYLAGRGSGGTPWRIGLLRGVELPRTDQPRLRPVLRLARLVLVRSARWIRRLLPG